MLLEMTPYEREQSSQALRAAAQRHGGWEDHGQQLASAIVASRYELTDS
jgi:hypothetical protein